MPEPFKNLFNPKMIKLMAVHFKRAWGKFDDQTFIKEASHNLGSHELKERSRQITRAMASHLPASFSKAAPILVKSLHIEDDVDLSGASMDDNGIRGFATMPMTEYVGEHGLIDFDLGMNVQKEITKRGSSEFGIRPFILSDQKRALATLKEWARSENFHVRRLVSEGSRPRLPWAMQLPPLIENPDPLFPILDLLKDDAQEYVRRSVANNLNDIAKDHPDKVAAITKKWLMGATIERERMLRHACRTLIKQGHKKTLSALGYENPKISLNSFDILTPVVQYGDALKFKIAIQSTATTDQNLIVDFIIHHQKANGKTSPKVFKWKTLNLKAGAEHNAEKKHAIKPITTRVYYPGTHRVEIMINGESQGITAFELVM